MKEEDTILRKVGTGNPFTVPQGYFENLASDVMDNLPDKMEPDFVQKEVTWWDKVKPWAYMAAMFAGAALIIRAASWSGHAEQVAADVVDDTEEAAYFQAVMDNSMCDEYDLYVYLSEGGEE